MSFKSRNYTHRGMDASTVHAYQLLHYRINLYIFIQGHNAKELMDSPQWKGLMGGFLQIKATKGKRKNMNNSFIYLIMITVNI